MRKSIIADDRIVFAVKYALMLVSEAAVKRGDIAVALCPTMPWRVDRLDLDNKIDAKVAVERAALVDNGNFLLPYKGDSGVRQFVVKTGFVDGLQQAGTKRAMHFDGTADHAARPRVCFDESHDVPSWLRAFVVIVCGGGEGVFNARWESLFRLACAGWVCPHC